MLITTLLLVGAVAMASVALGVLPGGVRRHGQAVVALILAFTATGVLILLVVGSIVFSQES